MKARYEMSKSDLEKTLFQYYDSVADGIVRQAVALTLYALHLQGWRKKRINWMYERILEVVDMPPVFGERMEGESMMNFLASQYGVDFDRIHVNKESFKEYRKR